LHFSSGLGGGIPLPLVCQIGFYRDLQEMSFHLYAEYRVIRRNFSHLLSLRRKEGKDNFFTFLHCAHSYHP
jgi:hypothetical protein